MEPGGLVLVGVVAIVAGIGRIALRKYAFIRWGMTDETVISLNAPVGAVAILAGVAMLIAAIAIEV